MAGAAAQAPAGRGEGVFVPPSRYFVRFQRGSMACRLAKMLGP